MHMRQRSLWPLSTLTLESVVFFKITFLKNYLFYACEYFTCMYISVPLLCLVPEEAGRGCQILWNRSLKMIVSHHVGKKN